MSTSFSKTAPGPTPGELKLGRGRVSWIGARLRATLPVGGARQRQCLAEVAPPGDRQLHVDAAEMRLDGLAGEEQLGGDLGVATTLGRERRDAELGGGQRVATGDPSPPRPATGDAQLGLR